MPLVARTRSIAAGVLVVLLLALLLNVGLYAGSRLGDEASWRLEHGRLGIQWGTWAKHDDFWVAGNTEPMRWEPEWSASEGHGGMWLPLWIPAAVAAVWFTVASRKRRAAVASD